MMKQLPTLLNPHEVADVLGISYEKALQFIRYSGMDYIKIGRQYRVDKDKLAEFMGKKGRIIIELKEPTL